MRRCPPVVVIALGVTGGPSGAVAQPIGTVFTFQGQLRDGGVPLTGEFDFQFRLFDAPAGGTQVGTTVSVADLPVVQGVFTTPLDFGSQFNGSKRWLQTEVRPGASTGAHTPITARQELTPTPYAIWSALPWATGTTGISYNGFAAIGSGPVANVRLHLQGSATADTASLKSDRGPAYSHIHYGPTGDWYIRSALPSGRVILQDSGGNVGVGTSSPDARLQAEAGVGQWAVFGRSPNGLGLFGQVSDPSANNLGTGVLGRSESANPASNAIFGYSSGSATAVHGVSEGGNALRGESHGASSSGVVGVSNQATGYGGFFYNLAGGGVALKADGLAQVKVLQILGGGDVAEPFDVSDAGVPIRPGHVVVIDEAHAGRLRLCDAAYDPKVAGIISGANDLAPGMILRTEHRPDADGGYPVAMAGRVWCFADASVGGPIRPGDRLTTSGVEGHAMRVMDPTRADGAVIGKAMSALEEGRGLVLVLVNLQ